MNSAAALNTHCTHSNQPAIVVGAAAGRSRDRNKPMRRKHRSDSRLKVKVDESRSRPDEPWAGMAGASDGINGSDPVLLLYFKEMVRAPLLSLAEEINLARQFEKGRLAEKKLAGVRGDINEIQQLKKQVSKGYQARDHLIRANTRLVVNIAKRYRDRGLPFADLIQEGNLGLIRAVEKYDYHRGYRFSTYATWWVKQAVSRALASQGRDIRLPVHYGGKLHKLNQASDQLVQALGRSPTHEEVAAEVGQALSQVERLFQVSQPSVSLDASFDDKESRVLSELISDESIPSPADAAVHFCLQTQLAEILGKLRPKEAAVLKLRFGLEDGHAYTLEEIGQRMGVTRERVRQIEGLALQKLRHSQDVAALRDYLTS